MIRKKFVLFFNLRVLTFTETKGSKGMVVNQAC